MKKINIRRFKKRAFGKIPAIKKGRRSTLAIIKQSLLLLFSDIRSVQLYL